MAKNKKVKKAKTRKKSVKKASKRKTGVSEIFVDDDYINEKEKKKSSEKRSDKNFFYALGIIVVGILVLVLIGLQFHGYEMNKDSYNNFRFYQKGMFWATFIEKDGMLTEIPFYYHPRELEEYVHQPGLEDLLLKHNGSVLITLDPDLNSTAVQAAVQVSRMTGERFNILNLPTQVGITNLPEGSAGNSTYPIVTCDDADNTTVVVWLKVGMVNSLYNSGNCIIIEGTDEQQLIRGAEKLDYLLLGIMR